MAKVLIEANVPTQIHPGGVEAVAFGNPSGVGVYLNTTDPTVDGQLVKLSHGDSLFLQAGGTEAAATWWALAGIDTVMTVTVFV